MEEECFTIWHHHYSPDPRQDNRDRILGDYPTKVEAIKALEAITSTMELKEVTEEDSHNSDYPAQDFEITTRVGHCVYDTPLYYDYGYKWSRTQDAQ